MASFEDNNPFAGTEELPNEELQTTAHFATAVEGNDDQTKASGAPSFKDSYDTSSHIADDPTNQYPASKHPYLSRIEQLLTEDPELDILITDAGKNHEGSGGGFITYTIRTGELAVRRRYSEFESLRNSLTRLFPTLIVPPIPEKHTMSDYAAAPTRAKGDLKIIEHRRRMLAVFLNRCRSMRQIREHIVFQKFLDPNVSWSEVLSSPPLTLIPKYVLRAPPLNTAAPTPAHAYLPVPSSSARLRIDDELEFQATEINAKDYELIMSSGIERVNKRALKRYADMANDMADLGARFNAWSLNESNSLATAIEKTGQAVDGSYIATEELVSSLSCTFSEPLGESAQFAAVVKAVLKYRHQKALQHVMTLNSLSIKRDLLTNLERTEMESQRIDDYLKNRDNFIREDSPPDTPVTNNGDEITETTNMYASAATETEEGSPPAETQNVESNGDIGLGSTILPAPAGEEDVFPPTHAESTYRTRRSNGFKFPGISKISDALHGIVDSDPEVTRRNNIGKTREQIQILEASLAVTDADLKAASESVKADLARYQKTKEQDLRKIMIAYAKCHVEWARKNLETWEDARMEIEKIKVK
ncbi:hypothetical protein V1511DRAFT_488451 [Dipodascopsis uninucleata]